MDSLKMGGEHEGGNHSEVSLSDESGCLRH